MKKLYFFGGSFFKWKNCWHLEFLMNQIFRQRFIIFKKWGIWVKYCWNYGPSKLLLRFVEYRLDQLKSKHTKIAVNSAMQYFEGCSQMSAKSLKIFDLPTTKWWPCKIFAKLNGNHLLMANIFKLHEYQTFGLMKMYDMCTMWFANNLPFILNVFPESSIHFT